MRSKRRMRELRSIEFLLRLENPAVDGTGYPIQPGTDGLLSKVIFVIKLFNEKHCTTIKYSYR